jgi:DNA-binding transcriptional ArsR family regulator
MGKELELLSMPMLTEAAECLKVMGHPVRLRIVDALMQGQFTVGEIAALCDLPQHQTSEHLRLMQLQGLLKNERRGRAVYYAIASPRLPELIRCIRSTCAGVQPST